MRRLCTDSLLVGTLVDKSSTPLHLKIQRLEEWRLVLHVFIVHLSLHCLLTDVFPPRPSLVGTHVELLSDVCWATGGWTEWADYPSTKWPPSGLSVGQQLCWCRASHWTAPPRWLEGGAGAGLLLARITDVFLAFKDGFVLFFPQRVPVDMERFESWLRIHEDVKEHSGGFQ